MLKPVKFDVLASVLERLRRELIQNHRFASGREEINDGKRIYKIISYIHEHIAEPISLKQLSKEFFLNPTYISQLFKSETGMNYHDYVMRLRVASAKKMLSTSDMSITQIACRTGFQNYRNLSQVFKRFENISPSKYKETLNIHTFS
jgi:two-component system response regulator YesN